MRQGSLIFPISLLGAVFCISMVLFGDVIPCASGGCALFSQSGVSSLMWVAGAIVFAGCAVMDSRGNRKVAYALVTACLLMDGVLLSIQGYLSMPCTMCMAVGLFFGFMGLGALIATYSSRRRILMAASLCFWCMGLWSAVMAMGMNELKPWAVYGDETAELKVFFSPSCEACKDVVNDVVREQRVPLDKVALYPVAKNEDDLNRICLLACSMGKGQDLTAAMDTCFGGECDGQGPWHGLANRLALRWRLLKNKLHLLRNGQDTVPIVMVMSKDLEPITLASLSDDEAVWDRSLKRKALDVSKGFSMQDLKSAGLMDDPWRSDADGDKQAEEVRGCGLVHDSDCNQ